MNIKSSKNKVVISNIGDIGITAELREICKKHAINNKLGFNLSCEILFDLDDPDSPNVLENEAVKTIKFFNALTRLNGCCGKGYRYKVTIEQEKVAKPTKQNEM